MGFVTAAMIGLGVVGLGVANKGVKEAKKSRKQQEAEMSRQEEQARNIARTPTTAPDAGAEIKLGTDGDSEEEERVPMQAGTKKPKNNQILHGIGGLGGGDSPLGSMGGMGRVIMNLLGRR